MFLSAEPLKSFGKKGKTLKKRKEIFCNETSKEIPKKGKEDQGSLIFLHYGMNSKNYVM